jgi:hypothetical protein
MNSVHESPFSKSRSWNEDDEVPELRDPRGLEEVIERAWKRKKTLADCELPEEFRLETPRPKQYWMGHQLVWGFCLVWAPIKFGVRGKEEFRFVARYHPHVDDELQMRWAIDDALAQRAIEARRATADETRIFRMAS